MTGLLVDHLWQSTVVAAIAGLLTLILRRNRAQTRYWLWLAASIKFLVPFAALVALGNQFSWLAPATVPRMEVLLFVDTPGADRPAFRIALPAPRVSESGRLNSSAMSSVAIGIWIVGTGLLLLGWAGRCRRVATIVRGAAPAEAGRVREGLRRLERFGGCVKSIALVSSNTSLEPGVFGVFRPVLLWPRRLEEHLSDEQVEAILAHELAHVRRRDNMAAAAHMVVQALFWFHPLVWWIGTRLVDERERACDEDVLRSGSDPQVYAESILETCRFCVESPLVCLSGVTGADLTARIETIMTNDARMALSAWRKLLLGVTAAVAVALPVVVGLLSAPYLHAQAPPLFQPALAGGTPAFEVASVKRNTDADGPKLFQALQAAG